MVKLTPEIRTYASAVAAVGGRMGKTAKEFGEVSKRSPKTVEEMQRMKDDYSKLLKEFESQEETLMRLNTPSSLRTKHSKLNQSYNKYVVSTEMAISSLDVENVKVDVELLKEAQRLQWEAAKEIVEISDLIAKKLGIK